MSDSKSKVAGRRFDSLFIYAMVYLTFLYGPVFFLPLFSFNDSLYVAFPLKGFTLEWYRAMANQTELVNSLLNSLKVAAIVSVISTILGTLAAKGVTRYRITGHGAIVGFIMIPLVIPSVSYTHLKLPTIYSV